MYNPSEQFRCEIIRGRTRSADDLLPAYAEIIYDICPCTEEIFGIEFNKQLSETLGNTTNKTLNNHRTEIAGKLFGMYYKNPEGIIFMSERTEKLLRTSDQPAFFKDICFKLQFPNGMDKFHTLKEKIRNKLSIRQYPFILKVLMLSYDYGYFLTKDDVGYYILNSLHVLQGLVTPEEVVKKIIEDKKENITKKVNTPGKPSSYSVQHINEQINYLELANLIKVKQKVIYINLKEEKTINLISEYWKAPLEFDVYKYNIEKLEGKNSLYYDWQLYYSQLNSSIDFSTTMDELNVEESTSNNEKSQSKTTTVEIGDEGERVVFQYEKNRVKSFNTRLANKVVHLGKTKGLGYDIQSVLAEPGDFAEFVKFIEVKTTKRVTPPDIKKGILNDTVNLTRNEYIAAAQNRENYVIYRVYLTPGQITMLVIKDPFGKIQNNDMKCTPLTYRLDFSASAIDEYLGEEGLK